MGRARGWSTLQSAESEGSEPPRINGVSKGEAALQRAEFYGAQHPSGNEKNRRAQVVSYCSGEKKNCFESSAKPHGPTL